MNVNAINAAYLRLLRRLPAAAGSSEVAGRLSSLTREQRDRLASTPLSLLSIGERDARLWQRLLDEPPGEDLFCDQGPAARELATLGAAVAGFAWQLARRDAHALRLLFCASRGWCSQIAAARYLDVVEVTRRHPDLVVPREQDNALFWGKLLGPAISGEREVRRAARLSALQLLSTRPRAATGTATWPVAACAARQPKLRVAEQVPGRPKRRHPR